MKITDNMLSILDQSGALDSNERKNVRTEQEKRLKDSISGLYLALHAFNKIVENSDWSMLVDVVPQVNDLWIALTNGKKQFAQSVSNEIETSERYEMVEMAFNPL